MQESVNRIFKNFTSLIISQVIFKVLTFVVMIIIARFLGAEGFGKLSYGLSFVWVFLFLADFGLTDIYVRDVAHNRGLLDKYISNILSLKMILGAVNLIIIFVLAGISSLDPDKFFIVLILGASIIMDSFMYFFRFIFRVKEDMLPEGFLIILESILKLFVVFLMISSGFRLAGPILVALALFIVSFLNMTISFFVFLKQTRCIKLSFDLNFWVYLIKHSSPLILIYIMSLLNFRVDVILLAILKGDIYAGLFNADFKLLEQFLLIPITLASVFFPVFSRYSGSFDKLGKIINRSTLWLFLLSIIIVAVIYIKGAWFVRIFYGSKFELAGDHIFIMSLFLIPFFIKPVFERFFYVVKEQWFVCKVYVFSLVFNLVLNYLFIPRWGINGSSVATFISEFFVAVLFFIFYKKLRFANIVSEKEDLAYPGDQIEKELY